MSLGILLAALLLLGTSLAARALSANAVLSQDLGDYDELPVKANEVIYKGSMVGLTAGYARALTAGDKFAGHAYAAVTGTSANGGAKVKVLRGIYRLQVTLASVAVTDLGKTVYASDDETYTLTPTSNSRVGKVVRYVTTNTCIVEFSTLGVLQTTLLYALAAAGTAHTNSTTETLIGSATIAANTLQVGDVLKVRFQGIATATNSTDTLTIKLYIGGLGGTALLTGTATDVANNNIFAGEAMIVIRTIGEGGTFVAVGTHTDVPAASGTAVHDITEITASTAINTTVDLVIGVGADWSVAHSGNSCRLDILTVELLRQAA